MGKSCFHGLCVPFLKLTNSFRRCSLSKRSLIIANVCAVYLVFALVGYSQQHQDKRTDKDKYRHTRGLYHLDNSNALPSYVDLHIGARAVVPTRSNVIYITLKSKRLKPANIRGTIRPKLRRKSRMTKSAKPAFTQNKVSSLEQETGQNRHSFVRKSSRNAVTESLNIIYDSQVDAQTDSHISSIRIYSPMAPPWFSPRDVEAMRFLADAKVLRIKEVYHGKFASLLMFEGETIGSVSNQQHTNLSTLCGGQCGVINSPVDNTEVFAFHLDRVLGLNRTLPAVSRKFRLLHGTSANTKTKFFRKLICNCNVWGLFIFDHQGTRETDRQIRINQITFPHLIGWNPSLWPQSPNYCLLHCHHSTLVPSIESWTPPWLKYSVKLSLI